MRRRKQKRGKKFLIAILLLLGIACMVTIAYLYVMIQEKRQAEQYRVFAEKLQEEERLKAEEERQILLKAQKEEKERIQKEKEEGTYLEPLPKGPVKVGDQTFTAGFEAKEDGNTVTVGDEDVLSTDAILIDLSLDRIVAKKGNMDRIYPASMTKILTILVAAEHMQNRIDTFTITDEIIAYSLRNGCSAAGFVPGEAVTVEDLFYGTILPSGGEAALALAVYTSGSQEAFVNLMNRKIEQLGLSETTHFTNCIGIYDENHYSTLYDMAMILKAAEENDFCREVLKTRVHYTEKTEQHQEPLILSNWFLRRIEDKDSGGYVAGAKTGFVNESGNCAASYFVSNTGRPYICVTVNTYNEWRCIYDHVAMYKLYTE